MARQACPRRVVPLGATRHSHNRSRALNLPHHWTSRVLMYRRIRFRSDRHYLSEFPSLSGAPQTQYQNPGQAVWGNPTQRTTQHTPVQRPQQHPISQQSNAQQPSQSQESPQQSREQVYTGSHMTSSNDDYHRGGQGGMGQLGASTQPQPTNVDEFPPLRRNGNDEDPQDRRGSLMQNAAFGGFPGSNTFSLPTGQDPTRHRLPSAQGGRSDSRTSTLVDRIMSPSALSFGRPHIAPDVVVRHL